MGSKDNPVTALGGVIVGKNPATLPSGAMHLAAVNMVSRDADTLESRRGLQRVLTTLRHDKLIPYGGLLFARQIDADGGDLFRLNAGLTTATSVGDLKDCATRRPQAASAGGRLFLTTGSDGGAGSLCLRVLDSTSVALRTAGGPIASSEYPGSGVTAVAGWLGIGYQAAYRYTLGYVTADGVQVIGPPSGRAIINNVGGIAAYTVGIGFVLPPGLSDSYFIQVWRSQQVLSPVEPDDDLRLVYERNLTTAECAALLVSVTDVVPDELRGEFLYTNPNSGEGIQSANNPPPLAEEVALHKDRLWLGRTTQPYEFSFKIIAIGGAGGMAANDRIIITSQTPALELTASTDFTVSTGGSASQNIMDTARSLVRGINSLPANVSVWAEYLSGPDDPIGEIRIYERRPNSGGAFLMYVDQRSGGAAWTMRSAFAPEFLPYLPGVGTALTFSLQRVANVVTATISSGNLTNALRVGDSVSLFNPAGTFGATTTTYTVLTIGATTFTYAETGANAGPTAGFVFNIATDNIAQASREAAVNRIHFSKPFEYEAFPLGDYADIGASDKGIIAMRVTRETLWVFKEDGLFRITGDDPTTFDVERVDATLIAITPECVQPFAESLVAWTTKGVVMISESSFDIISLDINPLLRAYLDFDATLATSRLSQCFFVVDEKDALLRLHLAGSSQNDAATVVGAGEAMVYSAATQTWHRWRYEEADGLAKPLTHGVVNPVDRRVYYVDAYKAAGEGFLWRDRTPTESKRYGDDLESGTVADRVAFLRRALWVAQVNKAPMRDKRFDEVTILFGKPVSEAGVITQPDTFIYGFGNENAENTSSDSFFGMVATYYPLLNTASATPVGPAVRIAVPIDFTRGQRLWVGGVNATIDVPFTIHGFSLLAEVLNASITR